MRCRAEKDGVLTQGSIHICLSASLSPEGSNTGHLETWVSRKTGSPVMIVRQLSATRRQQEVEFGGALEVTTGPALALLGSTSHLF